MKLRHTGAFIRAARAARISSPSPPQKLIPYPYASSTCSRWSSTQATSSESSATPFPDQSTPLPQQVDPEKTAAASASEAKSSSEHQDDREKQLRQILLDLDQGNKIVHVNPGLSGAKILGKPYLFDATTNVSQSILDLVGRNLYANPNHPLSITRELIESCFASPTYNHYTVADPVVTVADNFDVLGFPADHPGRSRTDTYYINSSHLLRTHTSAHQHDAFKALSTDPNGATGYTICADVYRRDAIDRSHFPIFHQMEGARIWGLPRFDPNVPKMDRYGHERERLNTILSDITTIPIHEARFSDQAASFYPEKNPMQLEHHPDEVNAVVRHLKRSLEHLTRTIFSAARAASPSASTQPQSELKGRWIEAYFPFTSPSFELEVLYNGDWLELLGSGVVQQPILNNAGLRHHIAWAWGLGIERFAMLLFNIPDIRLFWSTDPRFLNQFTRGKISRFEPFSKYPACYKDISFWINPSPAASSPIHPDPSSSTGAAAAGGDATKASPGETQPAAFHENDVMEIVRDVAGALAEDVTLVDEFVNSSGRKSLCYRINYRSLERTLTNDEVNTMHEQVSQRLQNSLNVELR
ncbi:phenylalanine-tRNA ligase [Exophiala mesophila]|uniref:Phenylalanine--tRNA ligase, mitochondrial n=1 Tax=Exophiala mesophila TaxID=212818 RepID=A0A0D2AG32_EXOME|nr:phenylalanine-tRNA ligase [Exophiala mesophila]KIV97883.1 phenylalanine-tRNA ligase [Exophiala mesophila]